MYSHLYKIMWANHDFAEGTTEVKYRSIVIRNGEKVADEIKSLYTFSVRMAKELLQSWNTNRPGNQWNSDHLVYIYYPI